jgi:hypothetical protein
MLPVCDNSGYKWEQKLEVKKLQMWEVKLSHYSKVNAHCFASVQCLIINVTAHTKLLNPFKPSDAMWRHTFHLSSICMPFAQ